MRADALRTHARIIAVATAQFGNHGTEASLNEIAKRAGVGSGTLYRHFPHRDDLIEACMATWESQLRGGADRAIETESSAEALLLRWAEVLTAHISVFRGGPTRLLRVLQHPTPFWMRRWHVLEHATQQILDRLAALDTTVNSDARGVCLLLCGMAATSEHAGLNDTAKRDLLLIITRGLIVAAAPRGRSVHAIDTAWAIDGRTTPTE